MKRILWMVLPTLLLHVAGSIAPAALVAFYDFNGNGSDATANPLDMTLTGGSGGGAGSAPTYSVDTPTAGNGYVFTGQSLQINAGPSFTYVSPGANTKLELNTFTIETWLKPSVSTANGVIYSYVPRGAGFDGRGILFGLSNGKLYLQYSNSANNSYTMVSGNATTLQADAWYHVAISFEWPFQGVNTSFAGYKFFVNGAVDGGSGVGYGTPAFTLGIDYNSAGAGGPNPETAYLSAFHVNNNTAPDAAVDINSSLPAGTRLDRFRIHNEVFGNYANGSQALQLDYFFAPEPASLALIGLGALMFHPRRRCTRRQSPYLDTIPRV